jgi:hypothetical protein
MNFLSVRHCRAEPDAADPPRESSLITCSSNAIRGRAKPLWNSPNVKPRLGQGYAKCLPYWRRLGRIAVPHPTEEKSCNLYLAT